MIVITRAEEAVREAQREDARDLAETVEQMDRLEMDAHGSERLRSMTAVAEVAGVGGTALSDDSDMVEVEVEGESPVARRRRCQFSGLDEVSDPEEWMKLHHFVSDDEL